MADDAAELERRLMAGGDDAWLTPGEVSTLLGRGYSRSTVHRMLKAGRISFKPTAGGQRLCNPDDVRRELVEARKVRRAGA